MKDSSIICNDVSLDYFSQYRLNLKKTIFHSCINFFTKKSQPPLQIKQALKGISVTFKKGDKVALIGKNGSGKSTFLRILSRIYPPSSGSIKITGQISSIFDIKVGLHPDATGYENIVLMGVLQGKTKKHMLKKYRDIEEFTELKDFLKLPVKTYSYGMKLRLAFGIATAIESEILLLDEVIGVGDQNFMNKAYKRIEDLSKKSQILIMTSHSLPILEKFCNKSIVLKEGKCAFFGQLSEGIEYYNKILT